IDGDHALRVPSSTRTLGENESAGFSRPPEEPAWAGSIGGIASRTAARRTARARTPERPLIRDVPIRTPSSPRRTPGPRGEWLWRRARYWFGGVARDGFLIGWGILLGKRWAGFWGWGMG